MRTCALFTVLALAGAACSGPEHGDDGRWAAAEGRAELCGTVLDAATGTPLAGVRVELPGGAPATSGDDGRFLVRDLPIGLEGEVTARDAHGRSARVVLRPLRSGRLEVVLHLGR